MAEHPEPLVVVLAEDNPEDQALVRAALLALERSSDLFCVGDGRRLIEYLDNRGEFADRAENPRPDVIIMDLDMPHMSGEEALRQIRAKADYSYVPVAVLTGREVDRELAGRLEGAAIFEKPFEFDDLVLLLHNLLVLVETQRLRADSAA